jgi:hypothetical protein
MDLKFFLEKYKKIEFSQNKIKEIVLDVFNKNNINLQKEDIHINESEINIKVSGVKKTEFFLKKRKIQEEVLLEFKNQSISINTIL